MCKKEEREREKGVESIFDDIIAKDFPNLGKETDIYVQELQRVAHMINPKRTTPRHIIIKMAKIRDKEKILKAARKSNNFTYKGTPIILSTDFSVAY